MFNSFEQPFYFCNIPSKSGKLAGQNLSDMRKSAFNYSVENLQLKEQISQLEKALVQSELRATALETMIEVAEKELKINIKKKSFSKWKNYLNIRNYS